MAEVIQINDTTWRIEDNGVRFFLLAGTEKALLIDSGMNTLNAKQIAESITKLPIMLLNTHADPDHISGNSNFDYSYMHPDEEDNYRALGGLGAILPAKDNDIIDLGSRPLKIILHTWAYTRQYSCTGYKQQSTYFRRHHTGWEYFYVQGTQKYVSLY